MGIMTAGYIYAHAKFDGDSMKSAPEGAKEHAILGNLVFAFGWLQPLNAFVRKHPPEGGKWPRKPDGKGGTKEDKPMVRIVWEWVHKGTGRLVTLTAMINIFLGLDRLGTKELEGLPDPELCPNPEKKMKIGLWGDQKGWFIAYDVWFIVILVVAIV